MRSLFRFCTYLLPVFSYLFLHGSVFAQSASAPLKEYHLRGGLPVFFSKLAKRDSVTIAYFGGSITAAKGGWRDQSASWIQSRFPDAKVSQIDAAIGGTGSDLGVFRLKNDVLLHQPDLVFVEFAVNDNGMSPDRILRTMEGIVRQIWQANLQTEICFVYTLTATTAPVLADGTLTNAMKAMEQVAEHYQIPSIQMGLEVVSQFKSGKLLFQGERQDHPDKIVFSKDNVHPYVETGHRLYAEAIARSLEGFEDAAEETRNGLKSPLSEDNWEDAKMFKADELIKSGAWKQVSPGADSIGRQFANRFPVLLKSESPGSSLSLTFKGRMIGLYDLVGPGCGQYVVTIDGQTTQLYPRFDRYSTYYRSHYFFLPELENGPHTVKWEVSNQQLDKMAILSTGNQKVGDLAKFAPNACYAGYVLLLGEKD